MPHRLHDPSHVAVATFEERQFEAVVAFSSNQVLSLHGARRPSVQRDALADGLERVAADVSADLHEVDAGYGLVRVGQGAGQLAVRGHQQHALGRDVEAANVRQKGDILGEEVVDGARVGVVAARADDP